MDNGKSVNIIYKLFLRGLPKDVQKYLKSAISPVVGFAGQSVWIMGKISLPFTLEDYRDSIQKTILTKFIMIKAPSLYNMLLGGTEL